jgi:hypothetical protein
MMDLRLTVHRVESYGPDHEFARVPIYGARRVVGGEEGYQQRYLDRDGVCARRYCAVCTKQVVDAVHDDHTWMGSKYAHNGDQVYLQCMVSKYLNFLSIHCDFPSCGAGFGTEVMLRASAFEATLEVLTASWARASYRV